MEINWLIISVVGNILLGLYAAALTTYTVIKSNKEKKRKISVTLSTGYKPVFPGGKVGSEWLLITVMNPGSRRVTVRTPYLTLPDGMSLITPIPLIPIRFPYRLEEGENIILPIEMSKIKHALINKGYSGIVKFKGNVSDATEKVYTSKKSCDFNIDKEYD